MGDPERYAAGQRAAGRNTPATSSGTDCEKYHKDGGDANGAVIPVVGQVTHHRDSRPATRDVLVPGLSGPASTPTGGEASDEIDGAEAGQ